MIAVSYHKGWFSAKNIRICSLKWLQWVITRYGLVQKKYQNPFTEMIAVSYHKVWFSAKNIRIILLSGARTFLWGFCRSETHKNDTNDWAKVHFLLWLLAMCMWEMFLFHTQSKTVLLFIFVVCYYFFFYSVAYISVFFLLHLCAVNVCNQRRC